MLSMPQNGRTNKSLGQRGEDEKQEENIERPAAIPISLSVVAIVWYSHYSQSFFWLSCKGMIIGKNYSSST